MNTKTFPARVEVLPDVMGFVEDILGELGCSVKNQSEVCVALEEIFVNIARYAYGGGEGDVNLSVAFEKESRTVTFLVADTGVPFNPLKNLEPDITLSAEERDIGGLGIFITKKVMDQITYAYNNGKNILTMSKRI